MMEFLKDITIVGVIKGQSSKHGNRSNRPTHTLIYKIGGETLYHFSQKDIHITDGTVLFIPKGESYTFEKVSDGNYCLINFDADFATAPTPHLFVPSDTDQILTLFKQLEQSQRLSGNMAKKYESLSLFYRILSILIANEQIPYNTPEQKERISPAIQYLEKHIFDCDLKISTLSLLCDMSEPSFRKLFISRFGASPKKYVIHQRMSQAKMMLESGDYESIAAIAHSVGYDDPLYFSKHFKQFYGCPPSLY